MAALDLTSFDAALKVHYTDIRIRNLVYRNHPWLGIVPKMTTFGGKNLPIPIRYGVPQGRSATFSDAQANKVASKFEDFVLTRVSNYGLASIKNEALEASIGDTNAFMRATVSEIDGILMAVSNDLALDLFRSGTGARGRISTSTAPTTDITLEDPEDVVAFEVGMVLEASATDGGTVHATTATITAVDRNDGVLTVDTNVGVAGWSTGWYLYQEGDSPNGGSNKKVTGLAGWLPSSDPSTGDNHFGVDRSVDPSRLAGVRYDGSSETHEEALMGAGAKLWREGGRPDIVFMNPAHYAALLKELSGKVEYDVVRSADAADVGFSAIRVHLPTGTVRVVPDPDCSVGVAYMLETETFKLYSLGPAPKIITYEGNRFLREASDDAVEVRTGYYAQLGCTAPGANARITLPSL